MSIKQIQIENDTLIHLLIIYIYIYSQTYIVKSNSCEFLTVCAVCV